MYINIFAFVLLLVELLSPCDLSPINDNNNPHQLQLANIFVNQPTSSAIMNTASKSIKWIKSLRNITENGGRTVLLECQVKSSYPVTFNWYRYNNPLDKNRFTIDQKPFRSSIRLKKLKESQAGFYTCEVSNGFQTIASTGFVRVQNSNIDSIDLNDDILPSIEFQPEIISNNEQLTDKFKCEIYTGDICRSIINSNYISITTLDQKNIEQNLIDNMQLLSNECRQILLPMICLFVYPICDTNRIHIRSICRTSCHSFQTSDSQVSHGIPTCDNLPPASDDASCVKINQQRNVSLSSITSPIIRRGILTDSLLVVLPSIFVPIALICLIIILFYYCCQNRKNKMHLSSCSSTLRPIKKSCHFHNTTSSSPFHSTINSRQNHHHITSSSSSSTNTNLTNIHHRQILFKPESKHFLFEDNSLSEISFTNIRFSQEIGEGEFGRIYIGELIDSTNKCIIKTLEHENVQQDYLREIEIFRQFQHINISGLIGICLQPQNAYSLMIYEHLNNGDLHEYLVLQRSKTIDMTDFLYISIQIVSGMIYLSEKKFLHNDLSTKNILISGHLNIKITNIARYHRKYQLDYYKIVNRLLPVRWMSIESLLSGVYSEMSDVWSFGVLLWEMFSYGIQPFFGQTNPEVIEMIRDRRLLTCPTNCPRTIYALMCSCWEEISEQRPTFIELMERLRQLEKKSSPPLSIDGESISVKNQGNVMSPNRRPAAQSMFVDKNSIRFEM